MVINDMLTAASDRESTTTGFIMFRGMVSNCCAGKMQSFQESTKMRVEIDAKAGRLKVSRLPGGKDKHNFFG
jgi:hypothetical protein